MAMSSRALHLREIFLTAVRGINVGPVQVGVTVYDNAGGTRRRI
jgi:hypothetical protein